MQKLQQIAHSLILRAGYHKPKVDPVGYENGEFMKLGNLATISAEQWAVTIVDNGNENFTKDHDATPDQLLPIVSEARQKAINDNYVYESLQTRAWKIDLDEFVRVW